MTPGKLVGIFLKRAHGEPMDSQQTAVLEASRGLVGSADRGGRRQVTLLSQERWTELMLEVGASLRPETRRANLILSGIDLDRSRGAYSPHRQLPSADRRRDGSVQAYGRSRGWFARCHEDLGRRGIRRSARRWPNFTRRPRGVGITTVRQSRNPQSTNADAGIY
jgi:hypothetical protein